MTHELNRRKFIHQLIQNSMVGAMVPTSIIFGGRALADPMTATAALSILGKGASVVSLFVRSGGGMRSMLKAQMQMLKVIAEQLDSIQSTLGAITIRLDDLSKDVWESNSWQYQTELTSVITAAANNYKVILEAADRDPNVWEGLQERRIIEETETNVRESSSRLQTVEEGFGPITAIIAPVALALEVATANRLLINTQVILGRLREYESWFDNMLSPNVAGSILDYVNKARNNHNRIGESILELEIGKSLNVKTMLLKEGPGFESHHEACVAYIADNRARNIERVRPWRYTETLNVGSGTLNMNSFLKTKVDNGTGTIVIDFSQFDTFSFSDPATKEWVGGIYQPETGTECQTKYGTAIVPTLDAMKLKLNGYSKTQTYEDERKKLHLLVDELNLERQRVTFGFKAFTLISAARRQLELYRNGLTQL